jgi:phage terminase large subunit
VSADLVRLLAETHDDPRAFAELVIKFTPRRWQAAVMDDIAARLAAGERHPRVLIRSCHGAGKTALAAALSLWFTATRPHSRGLTTGPTWGAVEGVFWVELARLYGGSLLARAGTGRLLTTELSFAPGWDLVGLSTDHPVNLEGRHSPTAAVRIVDEAKAVDPAVFESTEALLDAPETLDMWISTPSIPSGPFFSRDTNGGQSIVRAVVTIDDLIAEGLPGKAAWKAARLEEWGANSPEYESRCMARYISDGEGALFPFAWITRAESAGFTVDGTPICGVDPAGSVAGDATACAFIAGPDDGRYEVLGVTSWHAADTQVSKGKILLLAREAGSQTIACDVVGLGKGLSDSMRQDFKGVREFRASSAAREGDRFTNLKAETAWTLRGLLENGKIALPKDDALRRELLGMKYQITPAGKIRVVDPSDSPDLVDAVLIALAAASRVDGKVEVVYTRGTARYPAAPRVRLF